MHPSYYYRAHCCILVFDVTRKLTYQHLSDWYKEFREFCNEVPCILVANKIDVDYNVTRKEFKFAEKHNLPFYFVSAADGTNVVKVFQSAVAEAKRFKESGGDTMGEILRLLGEEKDSLFTEPTISAAATDTTGSRSLATESKYSGEHK